jgi:TPR repeat protein
MTASESNLPDDFSDVQEISSSSGRLRVFLEVTAAILILVGIYYLFAPKEELDLPPLQQQEIDPIIRTQIDAAQSDQPAVTVETAPDESAPSTTEAAPTETAVSLTDGDAARKIITSQRSDSRPLSELNRLASEYQQQGRVTDAYLLWFYAARQGDGEAAFTLATLHDPNHFKPGSSLLTEADATQAYKWYSAAAHQSIPQAAERLQALHATLKAQAETGDLSARRLLLNWQ